MTVNYDDYNSYQMGAEPKNLMETVTEFLKANPKGVVELKLESGETESCLLLVGKEIINASQMEDGSYHPNKVVKVIE